MWPRLYSLPAAAILDSSFSRSFSDMLFLYALPPVFSRLDIDFCNHASDLAFSPPVPTWTLLYGFGSRPAPYANELSQAFVGPGILAFGGALWR